MLSICIPVYNTDVVELATALSQQATKGNFDIEIRVYDDCSTIYKEVNQSIAKLENVIYEYMPKNLGRSAIRNKLAADSKGNSILYIDGDMQIVSDNFIAKYYGYHLTLQVVSGGISYTHKLPSKTVALRWKYGVKRESSNASHRQKYPYNSFLTSNVLIPRQLMLENQFDENILGYGHEDTKFGYQLYLRKYPILQIDNQLQHNGLELNEAFLNKTKTGIENLILLWKNMEYSQDFANFVRLLKTVNRHNNFLARTIFSLIFVTLHSLIKKNLSGDNPNLHLFDLYKLNIAYKTLKK